jgi:integrase
MEEMRGVSKDERTGFWKMHKTVNIPPEIAFDPTVLSKTIKGSTYETDEQAACEVLTKCIIAVKKELEEGPKRKNYTINDVTNRYWKTRKSKHQKHTAATHIPLLKMFFGSIFLHQIDNESEQLAEMIEYLKEEGNSNATINKKIGTLNHILKMASGFQGQRKVYGKQSKNVVWKENGMTLIPEYNEIGLLNHKAPKGHRLTGGQERVFLPLLTDHLRDVVVFDLNTGLRCANVRGLRWDWEVKIPGLGSAFRIPDSEMKAGVPHMVFLNSVAREIIDRQRGNHPDYVFTRPHEKRSGVVREPYTSYLKGTHYREAVRKAGLEHVRGKNRHFRFHDLRHTFASRLADMEVQDKTIKTLMGHSTGDITFDVYVHRHGPSLVAALEKLVTWSDEKAIRLVKVA